MFRSVAATAGLLLIGLLGCSSNTGSTPTDSKPSVGNKVVLLGDNYGGVKVEELGELIVTAEVEKPAEIMRVQAREDSPTDKTFGVQPGKYRAYRLKTGEKLLGKVYSTTDLAEGAKIKDLHSVGWIRLHGKTNGGVGEMTGMPVLVIEGTLTPP